MSKSNFVEVFCKGLSDMERSKCIVDALRPKALELELANKLSNSKEFFYRI
jgi:hypothetical protein